MKKLIVIDNFYENPEAVRAFALGKVEYFRREELAAEFAGTESKHSYVSTCAIEKMERAIGQKIKVEPHLRSFGVFAKTYAQDERRRIVHVDESDWTGLVYLTRPQDCRGGTVFYQHIQTGWDGIPSREQLLKNGYKDRNDFIHRFVTPQSRDPNLWRPLARVGLKFNRLILFRAGEMFHSAEGYFGTTDENCRLLQLFFCKTQE